MDIPLLHGYPYIERDESWMYFNHRLLSEARRNDIPLLERFNYLGIYSSNLDEFFRVRIASLRKLAEYNSVAKDEERQRARQTLVRIARLHKDYAQDYEEALKSIVHELEQEGISIINEQKLTEEQGREVRQYYWEYIASSINPIFICSNSFNPERHLKESLYLAIGLRPNINGNTESTPDLAIIEIPSKAYGRFVRLRDGSDGRSYIILLDDVLRYCLPYIFAGLPYTSYEAYTFKLTKDSEIELESDLRRSMVEQVYQGVKRRKRGEPIRVVYDSAMPKDLLDKLCRYADLGRSDTLLGGGRYHNIKDMVKFPDCGRKYLRYPEWKPLGIRGLTDTESLLAKVLERDMGIHFPYQSFDVFLRLLREAAISPYVKEIRITLYRVAQHSKVISALLAAAQNGKQVTAVIELLARFDEESNISWSKKLQDAGVHVVFGHEKLKIHSKLVHIIVDVNGKDKGIACIGTGNLHEGNARIYTDYMLMTADARIADDVKRVFDFIETPYLRTQFDHLLVAPNDMRSKLVELINQEIKAAKAGHYASIKMKLNHIVDEEMIHKLYEASRAGVNISLCIRGNCSLIPGLRNMSANIRVNAIIDRYLEHSRIYIFHNGGEPKFFLGSTDWMTRNLDKRIEVMTPVYDTQIQKELSLIVDYGIADTAQGHYVNTEGRLPKRFTIQDKTSLFRSQEALYNHYKSAVNQNHEG